MQWFQLTLSEAHTQPNTTQDSTTEDNTSEHGKGRNPVALWNVPSARYVRDVRVCLFSAR